MVDSLELGLKHGGGRVRAAAEDGRTWPFSDKLECKACGIPYEDPFPNLFSFNSPQGACPDCHGFGDLAVIDPEKVVPDDSLSLRDGAIEPWTKPVSKNVMKEMLRAARKRGIPTDVPFSRLTPPQRDFIMDGDGEWYGVKGFFDWLQTRKYKVQVRVFLSRYRKYVACPTCRQTRLNPQALSVKVGGLSIGDAVRLTVQEAQAFFSGLVLPPAEARVAEKLLAEIQGRLKFLLEVGLDYISLDRMTFTLSGGEAQRINLAAALSSSWSERCSSWTSRRSAFTRATTAASSRSSRSLKDVGNTVLVVEHDPEIVRAAEHLIDLGPRAGEHGGEIEFAGLARGLFPPARTR